jgi:hypothetical protein
MGRILNQQRKARPILLQCRTGLTFPTRCKLSLDQSACKLGKGFFKQFSKAIGNDDRGVCFGNCNSLETPEHLLLHCKHYAKVRRVLAKAFYKPRLILPILFYTTKGSAALLSFLKDTQMATFRWLLAVGALQEPTTTTRLQTQYDQIR